MPTTTMSPMPPAADAPATLLDRVRKGLTKPRPGIAAQERMTGRVLPMPEQIPTDARPSAVVLILYPVADEIYMLLMKRATDGRAHSGQISMPGGRWEKTDRTLADTALREAWEEVGLLRDDAEILGELTPLYIPISNFMMHPYVAYLPQRPDWQPSPVEVAEIIEVPLTWLMKGGDKTDHEITSPIDSSWVRVVPAYTLPDGQIVWGATAMVLSELEVLMINNANDPVC